MKASEVVPDELISDNDVLTNSKVYVARFDRPNLREISKTNRRASVNSSRDCNRFVRKSIQQWIVDEELTQHVRILPTSRMFNVLFFEADDKGGKRLEEAPHLVEVAADDGALELDTPQPDSLG